MTLKLLEHIGGGAHGQVWRAEWGGRIVAAKVLDGRESLDEQTALDEAKVLGTLTDPTFVQLHEITQHGGCWTLLLEWVKGSDLATVLRQRGPAPPAAAQSLIRTCASALNNAWCQGTPQGPLQLLHRDLKPSNLLIQSDGTVRICDLGLATRWTRPGRAAAGSPLYAAPERFLGEESRAGDVFSLGCIAAEMLTGRRVGGSAPHARAHARKQRATRADLQEQRVPSTLIEQIEAMLAFDPSQRPTAQELCTRRPSRRALKTWTTPSLWSRLIGGLILPTMEQPCPQL